ncbi:hypothetical protein [Rhizobium sp. GN54]|uniref:hypothetical protein n=1 Tax=Rhizobium sp. GN54 TaxID=2898150 RepID=UPI001E4884FA|nr:hypothetical protein [Rhizobium sp. GN54]MCD2181378.1 hypothetical protein [Rhizobium sp. GN54]
MDTSEDHKGEPEVGVLFRNGNLTVFGIVLSFSLGFLNTWASNPNEWQLTDLPTLILISTGIVFQARALWRLLRPNSLQKSVFEAGNRLFAVGLLLTAVGVIMSIAIDLARMAVD